MDAVEVRGCGEEQATGDDVCLVNSTVMADSKQDMKIDLDHSDIDPKSSSESQNDTKMLPDVLDEDSAEARSRKTLNPLSNLGQHKTSETELLADKINNANGNYITQEGCIVDKENNMVSKSINNNENSDFEPENVTNPTDEVKKIEDEICKPDKKLEQTSAPKTVVSTNDPEFKPRASPSKSVPRARKSVPGGRKSPTKSVHPQSTTSQQLSGITLQLKEIEKTLGIQSQSLSDIDAKTLDKLILQKANKVKRKESIDGTENKKDNVSNKQTPYFTEDSKLKNEPKSEPQETSSNSDSPVLETQKLPIKRKAGRPKKSLDGNSKPMRSSKAMVAKKTLPSSKKKKVPTATLR